MKSFSECDDSEKKDCNRLRLILEHAVLSNLDHNDQINLIISLMITFFGKSKQNFVESYYDVNRAMFAALFKEFDPAGEVDSFVGAVDQTKSN